MEPVAGEIHCFVVGARHQLRASMSAGAALPGRFAEIVGLDDSFEEFFPGKNPDLGAGLAGWRLRCRAGSAAGMWRSVSKPPMPGRNVLESTSGTCAFEVPRTGNRDQAFFGGCPRGVRSWKQACPFFSELPRVEFRVEFPSILG